jgi:hypothetical protein
MASIVEVYLSLTWKLLHWIADLLFWGALAWIVFGIKGNQRPARDLSSDQIEFAPHWFTIWAWLFIIGFMAVPGMRYVMQRQGSPWQIVFSTCLGFGALLEVIDFPGTIVVTRDGLEQIYWLRKRKRIRWKDIVEVETGIKEKAITITGADGTKIVHFSQLADRSRLLMELKRHCGEELPPDFPREPIDGI